MKMYRVWAPVVALLFSGALQASTVWDETLAGDLSNDGLGPTALSFALGSNVIAGMTGNPGPGVDRDYFSFVVPEGATLTALRILNSTTFSGGASFLGLQAGPQLTVSPSGSGSANLLGFVHYNNDQIGTDVLAGLYFGSPSLPSGIYSAWVQETGGPVGYAFDFELSPTPVPLPGGFVLLISAVGALLGKRTLMGRPR